MAATRVPVLLTAVAAAGALLSGCADEEVPVSTENPETSPQTESTELAPDATSGAEQEVGGLDQTARAITTAEGVEPGGRAVELEREDEDHFEISVLADGTHYDVSVSIDGERLLEQEEGETADDEELEELNTATVTMVEAMDAAMADRSGTIEHIELDTEDDAVVWEVTVATDGDEQEVVVDAANGEVR